MSITKVGREKSILKTWDSIALFLLPLLSPVNVGISAIAVLYTSFSFFNEMPNPSLLLSAFMLTFAVYLLNLVTDMEEDSVNQPSRMMLYEKRNVIYSLSIFSYIAALSIGFFISIWSVVVMLIPFIIGFIYSVKIANFRIKNLFLAKNISISLSWSLEASLMPFIFYPNHEYMLGVFLFIFIKGMINTILFDLRDVEGDRASNVITIPVKLGKRATFVILMALNTLLFLWLYLFKHLFSRHFFFSIAIIIYGYAYIIYFNISKSKRSLLYSILVDDEWVIWALLVNFL